MAIKAILWDYDGTLMDSSKKSIEVSLEVLSHFIPDVYENIPAPLSSRENFQETYGRISDWVELYHVCYGLNDEQTRRAVEMWGEVQEEIQEKDAEDAVVNRAPELRTLSENIDKATNTWINATLQLESAIQQYQRAERKMDSSVTDIRGKVDSINEHIDNVLKDAPTILQVSVNVADADWKKIQDLFD